MVPKYKPYSYNYHIAFHRAAVNACRVAVFPKAIHLSNDSAMSNIDTNSFEGFELIKALRIEHRQLDATISDLQSQLYVDQLYVRRLKKRKLVLREQISRLESELIPDLNA